MGTPQKPYILESIGSGVALLDYDNDGWLDIYIVNGSTYDAENGNAEPPHAALFHNNHDGTFTDVAEKAGVTNGRWGFGVAVGDFDNDGWPDIYVGNYGKNRLYHNNHDGTFTDIAESAGVALGNWSTGPSFGDYDGDGRLDLFVPGYIHWAMNNLPASGTKAVGFANCQYRGAQTMCGPRGLPGEPDHLFHNNGDGTFTDVSVKAGVDDKRRYYGFSSTFVDIFALKKSGSDELIAPLGTAAYSVAPNDTVEAYVVIQNKNIGHSLIPEVRDLYEAWVEFTVKDAAGKEIYHSGFLKPDGMLDPRAHSFTNRPVTNEGAFVDNHKVWTIHSVAYDNSVQAGRSVLVRYQFRVPAEAIGAVTVTAKVNYRHLRQSYLNNIFGKGHPAYPVVEIASRSRVLKIGENKPEAADPADNADWMRWNNLGIALLDQFQYQESINAFTEVIKLRPLYADAYTNVGLTEIVWEKYESARTAIRKALSLDPNSARALYYDGLLERRAGNTEQETADFRKVVEMFPQSRDARRELGITYYQQNNNPAALEQFEALQKIDPDDLTAHYNLSILYRRMGKPQEAAEQQAMFVDKKVDPGAPTYGLDFLRAHPEISTESIPWHLHSDLESNAGGPQNGK